MGDSLTCAEPGCVALPAPSSKFCEIHQRCEFALAAAVCPRCKKPIIGGHPGTGTRNLVVKTLDAKPENRYAHAQCESKRPTVNKRREAKPLLESPCQ